MPSVFLSHCSADKAFARKLGKDLALKRLGVWIDEAEIKIGESLIEKISEGISSTDYLIVILSPNSVKSSWVSKEVEIALAREINGKRLKVLPVLFRQCEVPPFLSVKRFADFTSNDLYESSLQLLVASLVPYEPWIRELEVAVCGLPAGAIMAFAARCARRMRPVYVTYFNRCPPAHAETIEKAVALVEKFAFKTTSNECSRFALGMAMPKGRTRTLRWQLQYALRN